jgi:hypothetical protein
VILSPAGTKQHGVGQLTRWSGLQIDPLDTALRLWTISGNDAGPRGSILSHSSRIGMAMRKTEGGALEGERFVVSWSRAATDCNFNASTQFHSLRAVADDQRGQSPAALPPGPVQSRRRAARPVQRRASLICA